MPGLYQSVIQITSAYREKVPKQSVLLVSFSGNFCFYNYHTSVIQISLIMFSKIFTKQQATRNVRFLSTVYCTGQDCSVGICAEHSLTIRWFDSMLTIVAFL